MIVFMMLLYVIEFGYEEFSIEYPHCIFKRSSFAKIHYSLTKFGWFSEFSLFGGFTVPRILMVWD